MSERLQWEETEIDKMIIGPFCTEETGRALKYPHLNLDNISMSKQSAALEKPDTVIADAAERLSAGGTGCFLPFSCSRYSS